MEVKKVLGLIGSAIALAVVAKIFAGGAYVMWLSLFFVGTLVYLSGVVTTARVSALARGGKVFVWTVLITIFLVNFLSRLTGKSLDGATNGTDALSLLLFASLLALFATKEAGWTDGATGKKWIKRLFVATFVYAVICSIWTSVPKAVDRFVVDTNWLIDSYGERKFKREMREAAKAQAEEDGENGIPPSTLTAGETVPFLPRGTVTMRNGEEREFLLRPIGIRLLEGRATIECVVCDFPRFYNERRRAREESNVISVDVERYYREHGTRPSVYHSDIFKIRIKAEGFLVFNAM